MESHAHDILRIKKQACNVTSKYYETFQIKRWPFLLNDWLTSSSFTSFYRFFSFFFQSNSKPFLSFPSQFCRLCSPLRSSLFPLSSLFSDFQMLSADSSTCTAWGRSHCVLLLHSAQLSIISLHPIRREQTVSVKVYQRIWALEVGNVWKKKVGERECACHGCVFWNKANTLCAIFKPHGRLHFLNESVIFQSLNISICSITSVLIEEMWNCGIHHGIIIVCYGILM